MNNLITLFCLAFISIAFTACEACSDCLRDRFDGSCTCLGITTDREDLSYTEEATWEETCETSSECEWSSTVNGEDTEEICDKRAEMEARVIAKEAIGWECINQ